MCGGVAVLERAFLACLAPEDLVVAVGVEGRVDVDEVHARVGEVLEMGEVVPAIDHARVYECGPPGANWYGCLWCPD